MALLKDAVRVLLAASVAVPATSNDLMTCRDRESSVSDASELKVVVSDAMGTMCGTSPVVSFEEMIGRCQAFCGDSISILMGTDGAGLNLEQMDSYCIGGGSDASSLKYNATLARHCKSWSTAVNELKDSAADLSAAAYTASYELVRFRTRMREMVKALREHMQSETFIKGVKTEVPSQKINKIRDGMMNYIKDHMGTTAMKEDVEEALTQFLSRAEAFERELPVEIDNIHSFMEQCTDMMLGTGNNDQYLLDICSVAGAQCIDHEEAQHIGCCCATIPAATVKDIPAVTSATSANRRLDETSAEGVDPNVDICGKAYDSASPQVKKIVNELLTTATGAAVLTDFSTAQSSKYESFYSRCDSARRLFEQGEATPGARESGSRYGVDQGRSLNYLTCDEPDPKSNLIFNNAHLKAVFDAETENALCKNIPTNDSAMADKCEAFCGEESIPMLLGSVLAFGFGMEDMDEICLNPTNENYFSEQYVDQCHEWADAFDDVLKKTGDLVAFVNLLDAAMVLFQTRANDVAETIHNNILTKAPQLFDDVAGGDAKIGALRNLIKDIWNDSGFATVKDRMKAAAQKVEDSGAVLKDAINQSVPKLENFLSQCGQLVTGVGPDSVYFADLCSQNSKACIDEPSASHLGCCCAYNPYASLGQKGVTWTIVGQDGLAAGASGRRLPEQPKFQLRDVCAEASDAAASDMNTYKSDIGESEWDRWRADKMNKYPAYYSRCGGQVYDAFIGAAAPPELPCHKDTGGVCSWLSCDSSRNSVCSDGKCVCDGGKCSVNGQCVGEGSAAHVAQTANWASRSSGSVLLAWLLAASAAVGAAALACGA